MDNTDRSSKTTWAKYMKANPIYFEFVMGKPCTAANVADAAERVFEGTSRMGDAAVQCLRKKNPKPRVTGVENIGKLIGLSRTMIFQYENRGMPIWKENGKRVGYIGRLEWWAKKRRIGKYGRGYDTRSNEAQGRDGGEISFVSPSIAGQGCADC